MQLPSPRDASPTRTSPAEDCLTINVWAPVGSSEKTLPVMVWIYGGGFVNGGSSPAIYNGTHFVRSGVVFVSFNYRLGRFGFFAHPALTSEDPDGLLGNYGYMDQIAALKWVRRNIATFGGDPQQVTLFGESAGGMSIHTLMISPLAKGLFQKAIIESGGGRFGIDGLHLRETVNGKPSAESIGLNFAKSKGITGEDAAALGKLRALPAESIVDSLNMGTIMTPQTFATYSGPMIDGKIVVEEPQTAYVTDTQIHIPVIVGANNREISFSQAKTLDAVFAPFGENAAAARRAYDPDHTGNLRAVNAKVASDALMVEPARFVAQVLSQAGQPVWEYRFSYVADSMRKKWPGAFHDSERPYVFNTVRAKYGSALTPADEKMAQIVNAYWVQFAKTGNPNKAGLPTWPQFSTKADKLMIFTGSGPKIEPDPWKQRLDLTEHLARKTKATTASRK